MNILGFSYHSACLAGVFLTVTVFLQAPSADTTLRWKFNAGQKWDYVLTQKMAMKMDFGGKPGKILTQSTDMSWEVKGVDTDGTANIVQTIRRIRYQMDQTDRPCTNHLRIAGCAVHCARPTS
jgi:hypothetical protein